MRAPSFRVDIVQSDPRISSQCEHHRIIREHRPMENGELILVS